MEDTLSQEILNVQEIKRKSVVGVIALTSGTFILQIIALISTFILTVLLDPSTFGIFYVVTAVVNFLNYFSDVGLAAALIQKKEEPTPHDLATTFTIQQILVLLAILISLLATPIISKIYSFGRGGSFLYQALIISFFLSSLKTIPSILLERKLEFKKQVIPQVVETIVFYAVAIVLAAKGYGIVSFGWAALARGISGTTLLYIIAPWKPQFLFSKESARKLLSFGLPFQTNSFLALVKDDLLTAFLGTILPFSAIGYIGWAEKWSEISLRLIMDNLIKVTFPTYSRLQSNPKLLSKAINTSILFLALLSLPVAIGMMFVIKPFILIVPRYIKWEPALLLFYLFTINRIFSTLSSPLINVLNALGKVRYTFYLMIMWTVLTWTLVPIFVHFFSFNGVAIAALVISLTSFIPYIFLPKTLTIDYKKQLKNPILATIGMCICLFVVYLILPAPIPRLLGSLSVGILTYSGIIYFLMGKELKPYISLIKTS